MKKLLACATVALAFTAVPARPALAQSSMEVSTQASIPESKRAVIHELVEVYNQQTSTSEVVDAMLAQMSASLPKMFEQLINDRTDLTAKEKEDINEKSGAAMARFSARFREEVLRQIDFRQYQEDVSMELYDKYFTEDELRDIVAFYRTPTGQKSLHVLPQLAAESMRISSERLGPQIVRIVQQIMQEQLDEIAPPKPHRTTRRA